MISQKTTHPPLITDNVTINVDMEKALIVYTYRNTLSEVETTVVYDWIKDILQTWFKEDDFRGAIFDFREVRKFAFGNTAVAKEESQEANQIQDLSVFPVALMVNNTRQEVKVRMTLMGDDTARKLIVKTEKDALKFINEWNLKHGRQFDVSDDLTNVFPKLDESGYQKS